MAESFLTQAEKIAALEDSLAESQAVVVALLRASGHDISVPNEHLEGMGEYDLVCTDDFIHDAKIFGVRCADPGVWSTYTESDCTHLTTLRDVRGPGGWRNRGPGYDHEHWELIEPEDADLSADVAAFGVADIHSPAAWYEPPAQQSEILPLSDQVQPLEPALPRIRSLALPDGRFAFVVSGWKPPEDIDEAQEFRVRMSGFARQCGAVAAGVFEEHLEVS